MTRCYRLFSDNLFVMRMGAISLRYACSLRLIALLIRQFQSQDRILSTMLASPAEAANRPTGSFRKRRLRSSYRRAERIEHSRYQTELTSDGRTAIIISVT